MTKRELLKAKKAVVVIVMLAALSAAVATGCKKKTEPVTSTTEVETIQESKDFSMELETLETKTYTPEEESSIAQEAEDTLARTDTNIITGEMMILPEDEEYISNVIADCKTDPDIYNMSESELAEYLNLCFGGFDVDDGQIVQYVKEVKEAATTKAAEIKVAQAETKAAQTETNAAQSETATTPTPTQAAVQNDDDLTGKDFFASIGLGYPEEGGSTLTDEEIDAFGITFH